MSSRHFWIPALALLALVLAGCNGGDEGTPGATTVPAPTISSSAVTESDGIRITLDLDKDTYQPGEPVQVTATVENTGDTAVNYRSRQPGEPALRLFATTYLAGEQPLEYEEGGVEAAVVEQGMLTPGEKLERTAVWRQDVNAYQTPIPQAPPGPYNVSAEFVVQRGDATETSTKSAVVTATLEGGRTVIAHLQAVQLSLKSPQVKDWLNASGGSLICALSNLGQFYNFNVETGEFNETFQEVYQDQLRRGLPVCSPVTEGEAWRVIFAAPAAAPPNRMSTLVGLYDGALLGVQEGAPTPRPSG